MWLSPCLIWYLCASGCVSACASVCVCVGVRVYVSVSVCLTASSSVSVSVCARVCVCVVGRYRTINASLLIGRDRHGVKNPAPFAAEEHARAAGLMGAYDVPRQPSTLAPSHPSGSSGAAAAEPSLSGQALLDALASTLGHHPSTLQRHYLGMAPLCGCVLTVTCSCALLWFSWLCCSSVSTLCLVVAVRVLGVAGATSCSSWSSCDRGGRV